MPPASAHGGAEYFDFRKRPEIESAIKNFGKFSLPPGIFGESGSDGSALISTSVVRRLPPHTVTREEFAFVYGHEYPDETVQEINLAESDSAYKECLARINVAKTLLPDARVENKAFLEKPDGRPPFLVTREEFEFLFGEAPDDALAVGQ